jgi:hypothetical protein
MSPKTAPALKRLLLRSLKIVLKHEHDRLKMSHRFKFRINQQNQALTGVFCTPNTVQEAPVGLDSAPKQDFGGQFGRTPVYQCRFVACKLLITFKHSRNKYMIYFSESKLAHRQCLYVISLTPKIKRKSVSSCRINKTLKTPCMLLNIFGQRKKQIS